MNKGHNLKDLLWLSVLDGLFTLWMNSPVVDTIQSLSHKLVTGVKIKATGESKHNDSTALIMKHEMKLLSRSLWKYHLQTTIEGFSEKRASGFLLKSELCQKCSKFCM